MKKILFILLLFSASQISAQTNVVQTGKGVLPQSYISYFLPQTEIVLEVSVKRTIQKQGKFVNYAKRLLALDNVIISKSEIYELEKVSVNYNVVLDTTKNFAVEINTKTTAYNLLLNENGIIKGVNVAASTTLSDRDGKHTTLPIQDTPKPNLDTTIYFNYSVLTEEALMATSETKMAEMAAKQIFRIRESKMEILSGESETEYSGEALQLVINELDKIEKELVALFEGKSITLTETKIFRFVPQSAMENEVIFRFSPLFGIVEKDDLVGRAITMSILPQNNYSEPPNEPDKKIKKFGLYYNVSSNAQITIFDGNKQVAENKFLFPQFGTLKFLPAELFNNKNTQVIFTEFGEIELVNSL